MVQRFRTLLQYRRSECSQMPLGTCRRCGAIISTRPICRTNAHPFSCAVNPASMARHFHEGLAANRRNAGARRPILSKRCLISAARGAQPVGNNRFFASWAGMSEGVGLRSASGLDQTLNPDWPTKSRTPIMISPSGRSSCGRQGVPSLGSHDSGFPLPRTAEFGGLHTVITV